MNGFSTYGMFGEGVSGSPAPQIYNAFFDELGVPAVFIPFPVEKERFITALPVLRSEFSGFTVCAPYRMEILAHLDALDENARRIGAVNAVSVKDGKLTGYNTDVTGFERSLVGFMGNMYDKDVLLLGSGGAAYAAANVLLSKGAFLTILSRNAAHGAVLKEKLQGKFNRNRVRVINGLTSGDAFYAAVNAAGIDIENEISEISISNNIYGSFKYVYDMHIGNTAFLKKAEEFGADTKDGFDMLFYQSVGAVEIWLGKGKLDISAISKVYEGVKTNLKTA
jgi:shikimate dehydrogenase